MSTLVDGAGVLLSNNVSSLFPNTECREHREQFGSKANPSREQNTPTKGPKQRGFDIPEDQTGPPWVPPAAVLVRHEKVATASIIEQVPATLATRGKCDLPLSHGGPDSARGNHSWHGGLYLVVRKRWQGVGGWLCTQGDVQGQMVILYTAGLKARIRDQG